MVPEIDKNELVRMLQQGITFIGDSAEQVSRQGATKLNEMLDEQIDDSEDSQESTDRDTIIVDKLPPRPKAMKPGEIKSVRKQINASVGQFAQLLNTQEETIQSWEDGETEPSGAYLKLLQIAKHSPAALLVES